LSSRRETEFKSDDNKRFEKAVDKLRSVSMEIVADIGEFQRAYKHSDVDSELPKRFHFTHLETIAGCYSLHEIYVGPKGGYRAVVMFLHIRVGGKLQAIWVFAFKKQRNIDRPMIEREKKIDSE